MDSQRVNVVKILYKNGETFAETVCKTSTFFGHHNAPPRSTLVGFINATCHTVNETVELLHIRFEGRVISQ